MTTTFSIKEKIVFVIFFLGFAIPEIIWGMVTKYWFYSLFGTWKMLEQNVAFLSDNVNGKLYANVLFLQIFSIFALLTFVVFKRKKIKLYIPIIILLLILTSLGSIVLVYAYSLSYVQYSIGW